MADTTTGNGQASEAGQVFAMRQLYVKDISFESPNAPASFKGEFQGEPDVKLSLHSSHRQMGEGVYEVVLHVNVHATAKDKSLFLVEVEQAALFELAGFDVDQSKIMLGTQCPAALFPFAREVVASLVSKGGFPKLLLQPINFEALYQQAMQARTNA